jgi:hypothetical protein
VYEHSASSSSSSPKSVSWTYSLSLGEIWEAELSRPQNGGVTQQNVGVCSNAHICLDPVLFLQKRPLRDSRASAAAYTENGPLPTNTRHEFCMKYSGGQGVQIISSLKMLPWFEPRQVGLMPQRCKSNWQPWLQLPGNGSRVFVDGNPRHQFLISKRLRREGRVSNTACAALYLGCLQSSVTSSRGYISGMPRGTEITTVPY